MRRTNAPLLNLLALGLCLVSVSAAGTDEFVNVSGMAEMEAYPDEVRIRCGVTKVHKKLDSAVAHTSRVSKTLLKIAESFGIDKADIGTEISELRREYRNSQDTATYLGIKSELIYSIKVRGVDSISRIINTLYASGMNDLRDISFSHSNQDSLKRVLTETAMAHALENAKAMVKNQGRKVEKLISASYEMPGDFSVNTRGSVGDLLGGYWGGDAGAPGSRLEIEYLKILPKKIRMSVQVYAKYAIK